MYYIHTYTHIYIYIYKYTQMDDLPGDFLSPLSRGDAVDEFPSPGLS